MTINDTAFSSQAIIPAPESPERLIIAHEDEAIRNELESLIAGTPLAGNAVSCSHWTQVSTLLAHNATETIVVISHRMVRNERSRMAALRGPKCKTLLVLKGTDGQEVEEAVELGSEGILIEGSLSAAGFLEAIRELRSGPLPVPRDPSRGLPPALQHSTPKETAGATLLTPRETETLKLLAQGYRNKQIADVLGISVNGAKRHVSNVLAKLNCSNRTLAATEAVRLRII